MTTDADGPLNLRIGSTSARYENTAPYLRFLSALAWGRIHGPRQATVSVHTFGPGRDEYHGIHGDEDQDEHVREMLR